MDGIRTLPEIKRKLNTAWEAVLVSKNGDDYKIKEIINGYWITDVNNPSNYKRKLFDTIDDAYLELWDDTKNKFYPQFKKEDSPEVEKEDAPPPENNFEVKRNDGTGMWQVWRDGKLIEVYATESEANNHTNSYSIEEITQAWVDWNPDPTKNYYKGQEIKYIYENDDLYFICFEDDKFKSKQITKSDFLNYKKRGVKVKGIKKQGEVKKHNKKYSGDEVGSALERLIDRRMLEQITGESLK